MFLAIFHACNRGSTPSGDAINKNSGLENFPGPCFVFSKISPSTIPSRHGGKG